MNEALERNYDMDDLDEDDLDDELNELEADLKLQGLMSNSNNNKNTMPNMNNPMVNHNQM